MQHIPSIASTDNPFRYMWGLGYHRLVPIIPPGAPIAEKSILSKRIAAGKDPRGKAPGVQSSDGSWRGFNFTAHESEESDLDAWNRMGAGVGVKTGRGLIAVDIDTKHKPTAKMLFELATEMLHLEPVVVRFGERPKALLVCRISADIPYDKVTFQTEVEQDPRKPALVEILTEGRQFVAHGVHPKTGKPYDWPMGMPAYDELPVIDPADLGLYMDEVARIMPAPQRFSGATQERGEIEQGALRGDPELIADAMKYLPNRDDDFPTRDDWLRMGYAIKAGMGPEHENDALDLFQCWSARWEGDNDPEYVEHEWARMKPPFGIGASFIYEKAEELGGWSGRAATFFEKQGPGEIDVSEFPTASPPRPALVAGTLDLDALDWVPPRAWLYGHKLIRGFVTFIASPGGVGKTALTIGMTLACASGQQLLHDAPIRPLRVWRLNLEDPLDEERRRLKAAFSHYGLDMSVASNIRVNSGRDRRVSVLRQTKDGLMIEPDATAIVEEIRRNEIDVLIVDPVLRSHRVSENDNEAQDELLRVYSQIAEAANCAVVLVHHFRKGGTSGDMDSMRGGSAQGGGARVVLTLAPMSQEEAAKLGIDETQRRRYVRIDDAKQNMSPPAGRVEWIELKSVELGNGTPEYPQGDSVQVASAFRLPEPMDGLQGVSERSMLLDIEAGPQEGERYSGRPQDKQRWAGMVLMERYGRSRAQAIALLNHWMAENKLESRPYRSVAQRKERTGLFVNLVALHEESVSGLTTDNEDLFA